MEIKNYEKIYIANNQEFNLFSFKTKDINRVIPMHFHQELEVIYCLSGKMRIWLGSEVTILSANEFIVINSLFPHSTQSFEPGEYIVIYFRPTLFLDNEVRIYVSQQSDKKEAYKKETAIIKQLFTSTNKDQEYILFHQRSLLNEFIFILLKEFSTKEKLDQRILNRNRKIKEIIQLMEEHYTNQLTLVDLATLSGYTPTYLSRMFKDNIGQTFSEYKKSLCVEHALNLIENTDLAFEVVAQKAGFPNEKSLRNGFKERMKMTPRDYVKKLKRQ